ncbi:MAG: Fe-S-cluster-containing dehydrogenase component/anaerobic selenocysteine-containing dehydrogenase [Myxococcota bacterium]|jgi:Fe-S-cluster-containing dehydrogenase component/anaerobic selenocysteine-containing dehydrogenase
MNRRSFLKALGLGGGVSAISACGIDDNRYYTPVEQLLPYVVRPEQTTPGTNTYFATSVLSGPDAYPVTAVHRDGRVINVDINSQARTGPAVGAAALFELQRHFSPDRIHSPLDGSSVAGIPTDWEAALSKLGSAVKAARQGGKKVAWLGRYRSGTIVGLLQDLTGGNAVFYEPLGRAAEATAAEKLFGTRTLPHYALDQAHYVLSFGADFLGHWGGVWSSVDYAAARDANNGHWVARFGFVSPHRSQTGANADDWHACSPGSEALVALAVAKLVAAKKGYTGPALALVNSGDLGAAAVASGLSEEVITDIAAQVAAGPSLALPGGTAGASTQSVDLAVATYLINVVSGAAGTLFTLNGYRSPVHDFSAVQALLAEAAAGGVGVLLLDDGVDPAHDLPANANVADALSKVGLVVSMSSHGSDTAALAGLVLPTSDAFEDWGDEEPRSGTLLLRQPSQSPMYDTRSLGDIVLATLRAVGAPNAPQGTWRDHLMATWQSKHWPTQAFWDEVGGYDAKFPVRKLKEFLGLVPPAEEAPAVEAAPEAPLDEEAARVAAEAEANAERVAGLAFLRWWEGRLKDGYYLSPEGILRSEMKPRAYAFGAAAAPAGSGDYHLHVFPHAHLIEGRYANQPWAQEQPDPLTGQVWGTWVQVHPDTAAKLGVSDNDALTLQTEAGSLDLGVEITRMVRPDVLAVPFGGGHTAAAGRYAEGMGANVVSLLTAVSASGAMAWQQARVSARAAGQKADLVGTFGGDSDNDRNFAVNVEAAAFAKVGDAAAHHPGELTGISHLPMDKRLVEKGIAGFYPEPQHPTYRFALTVDTDACTGCGACAVACAAENNLPMVGREKVAQGREMSWIRINRYFKDDEVHFVPMMCQHCGHAPCESVCPVLATYHSIDGLNAMIYNRCAGTRYCSNACPYSVRKFNYHTYAWPEPFNLQLNPDVSTRTMGVMEKCTFCVQRIRTVKSAYRDIGFNETVPDSALRQLTACAAACPSQALTFGNRNDEASAPASTSKSARNYIPIAELNTYPAVNYLAKLTFHAKKSHHGGGHAAGGHENDHGDDHGAEQHDHDASHDAEQH